MPGEQELLDKILNILKFKAKGMTITEISHSTNIHRNSIAKYLQVLLASGKVDEHLIGNAKVYTISRRLPISKMLQFSPDLILLLNQGGKIIQVNDKYLQYFNLKEQDILNKFIDELTIPIISDTELVPLIEACIENGEKTCKEITYTYDETTYNFFLMFVPSVLEGGDHGLIVIIKDFTEEKRMRDCLTENEEKFKNLFNNANDAIFLYEITDTRRIGALIEVNDTACRKLHYSRDELFGKKFPEIFRAPSNVSDDAIEPDLAENYHSIYEGILVRKDGISFPVEASSHVFTLKDRLVVLSVHRDISERKKAEKCITISENRYRNIVEGQQELICRMSLDHSLNYVNEAFSSHFNVPKEMPIAKELDSLDIYPDDTGLIRASVNLADAEKRSQTVEFRTLQTGGKPRWVEGSISPILDTNGSIFEFQFVGRDVTDAKLVKEALKRNEKNTRFLLNSINDGSLLIDLEGRLLSLNKSSCEYIRKYCGDDSLTIQSILGRSIYEFIPEDIGESIRDISSEIVSSKLSDSFVDEIDGRIFDFSLSPIINSGGEVEKIAVVKRDVTERKEYESGLTSTISRLTDIIDFLPEATFVINSDSEVMAWNRAMEQLTGIPKEEILGRGDQSYSVPFYGTRRPMLIDYVLSHDITHFNPPPTIRKEKNALSMEVWSSHLNDGNGAFLWAKATGLYDEGGAVIGAIESIQDMTQRKRMENEIQQSEEKYRDLVEKTCAIVLKTDADGTILFVNEFGEDLLGFRKGELIGASAVDTIFSGTPENARMFRNIIEKILDDPALYRITEHEYAGRGGDKKWISWTNSPVIDAEGRLTGISAVGTDITDRKESEIKEREYVKNLEFISRSAMSFASLPRSETIYDYIASELTTLLPGGVAVVTAFDDNPGTLQIKSIKGEIEGYENMLSSMLNRRVLDTRFKIPEEYRTYLNSNRLIHLSGGLYDLFLKNFSEDVCSIINDVLDLYECYMIGISRDNRLFGSISFAVPHRIDDATISIIEIFVNQASVTLQRCRYEEELAKKAGVGEMGEGDGSEAEQSHHRLRRVLEGIKNDHILYVSRQNGVFSSICDKYPGRPVFSVDRKGIITRANSTLTDLLGDGTSIIGKDIAAFLPRSSHPEVKEVQKQMVETADAGSVEISVPLLSGPGDPVNVRWQLERMYDPTGDVSNILWIGSGYQP
ncbi:PAS domain S-box protein [Methanovulcanius yangii]|uniref:PAS domain S-box protein n=1 Tax=Methanovulcanius yangii TaxID=1789227 RepID=UPI0029CA16BF|nr:PAS domain S-box protein [Methanovulcanius yangii]